MRHLAALALLCACLIDCASTTAAQKQCLENLAATQAVVTAEEAIGCNGDKSCIEQAAKERALISLEYASACLQPIGQADAARPAQP